jgi:hypothetical protein
VIAGDNLSGDHLTDFLGGHTALLKKTGDHRRAEPCRRHIGQNAAEAAERGAQCLHNINVLHRSSSLT